MPPTKPFFAQFAVWLLLFQPLTPIAFANFDITTICSSDGIEQIALDANGNPVELPSPERHCELCILYSPQAPVTLADDATTPILNRAGHRATRLEATHHHQITSLGFSSRAPPLFS